jgi:predicted nucleic acid-binding protein
MTVTVDASVLVAALVDAGERGRWAETILERGSLVAPELAMVETANVLRRMETMGDISRFPHRPRLIVQSSLPDRRERP